MVIFWRLMLGHFLADFTFQTNFVNRWKRSSLWGMLVHSGTHPLCCAALTWPYLFDRWVSLGPLQLAGWHCVFIIFLTHFLEDQWRVFTIFRYNTPDNTLYFLWDQVIHYAVIFAVVPEAFRGGAALPFAAEKWPVLGCLFVLVTHAATVLIYFVEKDLYHRVFPGTQEKHLAMLERLVLALCFLVPGNFFVLLVLGWLAVMHSIRAQRWLDLSWMSFYLGAAIAASCGLAARVVYYLPGTPGPIP